eukprot:Platyproteum_vivax@DN3876_c0_g1_i3.p1
MFFQNLTILTVLFFLCIKFGDARTYAISTKKNGEKTCVGLEIAAEQKESFVNIMKTVIAEKYVPFVGTVIPVHQTDQLRGYYEWNGFYSGNEMSVLDLTHMDENIGEANFKKAKKIERKRVFGCISGEHFVGHCTKVQARFRDKNQEWKKHYS